MPTTTMTAEPSIDVPRASPQREPLAQVAEVAGDVAARAARSVDGGTVGRASDALGGVADLLGAIDRLLATVIVVLMRCERPRVVAEHGLTIESWLRAVARRTGADAGMLMIAAERLADMPATLRAFRDGVLSWGTVRGIVCAVKALTGEQRRWLDGTLAGDDARVRCLDGDAIVAAAGQLADQVRPDLQQQRAEGETAGQRLVLQPGMDGTGMAIAAMDAETFSAVQTALETLTHDAAGRRVASNIEALRALARQRLARSGHGRTGRGNEEEGASDTPARVTPDDDGPRDAAGGGAPSTARPEMIVVTDVSLLLDPLHDIDRRGVEQATDAATTSGAIARLLWRQDRPAPALTPKAVQRLACDATVRPVLTDGARVLGTAEPYARVSASLRAALIARDGHCRFAACHRPVDVCETHHIVPRFHGGPTVLDNLALLCAAHRHAVHEGRWRATLHDDGSMLFVRGGVTLRSLPLGGQLPALVRPPPTGRRRRGREGRCGVAAGDDQDGTDGPATRAGAEDLPF